MPRKVPASRFVSALSVLPAFLLGTTVLHAQGLPDPTASVAPHVRLAQSSGELKGTAQRASDRPAVAEDVLSSEAGSARMIKTPKVVRVKRIRYVAPEYPARALHEGVSGFVVIDFVLNDKGEPTDLQVVDAQPAGIFNAAALDAVKRWRYESNITSAEVPTRTTVRFQLPVFETPKRSGT